MYLKILQLNIFQGKFLDRVIEFCRKQNVDILHFQEVTAGRMSRGGKYSYPNDLNVNKLFANKKYEGINCFEEIKKKLGMNGELVRTTGLIGDDKSYFGNATFYNNKLGKDSSEVIWLKEYFEIDENFTDIPALSRAAIITKFKVGSKKLCTINTHLTWGPNAEDEPYKIEQAEKLYESLERLPKPFILTGDFNVTPETRTASMPDDLGRNLVKEHNVINTLNPRTHPAKVLFPPGLAVDYIFPSDGVRVKNFKVIDNIDLSDHYALLLEFEV